MPLNKVARSIKINKMKEELEGELGREPTNKELSDVTNVPSQEIKEIKILFLDDLIKNRDDSLLDYITDERYNSHEKFISNNFIDYFFGGVRLNDEEKDIIKKLAEGKTLKEIGEDYGVKKQRIGQKKDELIKKIRSCYREMDIKEKLGIRVR